MFEELKLWNFHAHEDVRLKPSGHHFHLNTCQRQMLLGFHSPEYLPSQIPTHQYLEGKDAYIFLLETICGLQSKMIGENEIVGQFKAAYQNYISQEFRNSKILQILEKLFKDAKEIRTEYLIGLSQKTYSSLARRYLLNHAKASHALIIGSGSLAEDMINQLKKKIPITICARNIERVQELSGNHGIATLDWKLREHILKYPYIVNTVGTNEILFNQDFSKRWLKGHHRSLLVDLSDHSPWEKFDELSHNTIGLEDIFQEGAIVEEKKQRKLNQAKVAMNQLALRLAHHFKSKWERQNSNLSPQNVSLMRYV